MSLQFAGSIPLGINVSGAQDTTGMVIDNVNGFIYIADWHYPPDLVKVRISDFTKVGSLDYRGVNNDQAAMGLGIDTANNYLYFSCHGRPIKIVRVDLSTFTKSGRVAFPPNNNSKKRCPAAIDTVNRFIYFGNYRGNETVYTPSIFKATLPDLTTSILNLGPGDDNIRTAIIDPINQFAYFGTQTSGIPGRIIKIRLSDFTRDSSIDLNQGEGGICSSVIDTRNGFAYFGTDNTPGKIIKIRLSDFTRDSSIDLGPGEGNLTAASIDLTNQFAYFGGFNGVNPFVVQINLSDFTKKDIIIVDSQTQPWISSVIDVSSNPNNPNNQLYFLNNSANLVKINILPPANIVSSMLTVDKTNCAPPCTVNGTVSWTNTGGPGTFNPRILVNNTPTILGTDVPINAEETLSYSFQLSDLSPDTYVICADPDTGTTCQTVTVLTPANIISTNIVPSATECVEPCTISVDVTWTNIGGTSGIFIPSIIVDSIITSLPSESLDAGSSITHTFNITGLLSGDHTICADPDTGTICTTITVHTPANVISSDLTVDTTDCISPCTINGTVRWINLGGTESSPIDLSITVNESSIPIDSAVVIGPGMTTTLYTFSIPDLTEGTYTIQAVPNSGTYPQTVNVRPVAQAGFGPVGILLLGGLLVGSLLFRKTCEEHKTTEDCIRAGCKQINGKCARKTP